jgi:FAD binding domain/Berberine and berberine like
MNIKAQTTDGQLVKIDSSVLESFKSTIHGEVIAPQDQEYDTVRTVWNGMIDRRPALIVRCFGTADVIKAVRFAKEHNLLISVRGAGHNIAGRALGDDVFLIDLSKLRYVHVDPEEATATVSPGATLADVDQETQVYGFALPVGINSTTGLAGLTLGGGFGWLSRKYGLTVDNLISVEMITVEGERLVCSQDRHPDLFWALRGGGGNFGIVTSFKFKLHQVGPILLSGPVVFQIKDAKEVFHRYLEFCKNAPEEVAVWSLIRPCPPFPFVDASYAGKLVLILIGIYSGPVEEGKKILSQLKEMGSPIGDDLAPHPFTAFQKAFDPFLTKGARNYWKTHNFKEIDERLIDTVLEHASKCPSPYSELFLAQVGGKTNRVAQDAMAYPHRDIEFIMNVHTRWEDKGDDRACVTWAKGLFEAVKPFATGGSYVNFVSEGDDSLVGAYSENLEKLVAIKAKYDPRNVLRSNLNISPK